MCGVVVRLVIFHTIGLFSSFGQIVFIIII